MSEFKSELVQIIQDILNSEINSEINCINRETLYHLVKERVKVPYEMYKFKLLVTKAIKEDIIKGFKLKLGRGGGIIRSEPCQGSLGCDLGEKLSETLG